MMGHLLPADQDIHRELVQFNVDLTLPSYKEGESMVEWWGHVFDKPQKYPSLSAMVKCCLSIFHGPRVESSFSLMHDVIDHTHESKYGSHECGSAHISSAAATYQQSRRQAAEVERRVRLKHAAKQRKRAMETLVQAKKKK